MYSASGKRDMIERIIIETLSNLDTEVVVYDF